MLHTNLAQGKWLTMTMAEQLGNVGSEFERALSARKLGDEARFLNATHRFYELINLTLGDPRWKGGRRRELARIKEESAMCLDGEKIDGAWLREYFLQFAFLARANH